MKQKGIQVPKKKGEPIRRILIEQGILDASAKISSDDVFLYFPVLREPAIQELLQLKQILEDINVDDYEFELMEKQPTFEDLLGYVPHYEIVGDIAVIDSDNEPESSRIADTILKVHPNIKTVLGTIAPVGGEYRVRNVKVIAGENRTETIHKEHGCKYAVDIAEAYFTPRLSTERERVLSQISSGDAVVDMFAGVGPYSILVAKKTEAKEVIAIDKNPSAIRFLRRNIELNSVNNVVTVEGDADIEALKFAGTADHVIMNLPHSAEDFLGTAVRTTKLGGIIHYYDINPENDLFDTSLELIENTAKSYGREIEVVNKRVVRSYAPHEFNICIDVKVN
ncbi:MAG: class I SAM-dependent methyltransferase [Methanohalobium sp.]|uniref:class I SAM-dependent methyltransferase n=1 Tax=Methanohalobium sp. TaxID=2837493 RepID=UPI0039797F03